MPGPAVTSMAPWAILRGLYCAVTAAWPLAVLIFTDRPVWFGSGALAWSHVVTGLLLAQLIIQRLSRAAPPGDAAREERNLGFAVLITSVLALVALLVYAGELTAAVVAPDAPASPLARQLAGVMWTTEREFGILAFVLLALTAAVHVVTIISMSAVLGDYAERNKRL